MGTPQTSSPEGMLPEIHLLCMHERFSEAFNTAVEAHFPALHQHTPRITIHNCALQFVPKEVHFDAVVSPANSYGRLDGAFDDALARAYAPTEQDYDWITRKAQAVLYDQWKGFAPPGTCTIVPLDHAGEPHFHGGNPWGTEYLLLCPTMRIPVDVRWDREVVYECIWSLLCAVDGHNRRVRAGAQKEIKSILMTPLATGVGRVSPARWAEQCVIAMKYFVEASKDPPGWSNLQWDKILNDSGEIEATYKV